MRKVIFHRALLLTALAALCASPGAAQAPEGAKKPPEVYQVMKSKGGVYPAPMRPLWKLADLKKMHAGQSNWQQLIIKDPRQEATYNSAAPGTNFVTRMHPDTDTLFVVVAGQVHFTVEGQQPVTATRGSTVNILRSALFSYEVEGAQNALWVEIDPVDYKTVYPAGVTAPPPGPGRQLVTVTFNNGVHFPGSYSAPNQLHVNTFDIIANCKPAGKLVLEDHLAVDVNPAFVNPADDKCHPSKPAAAPRNLNTPFNSHSTFGHLHIGQAEWWIVQAGGIRGRFENAGEFHAVEGDVLYAPPSTWHQMDPEGPSGPSIRLVMSAYYQFNMYTTQGP